MEITGVNGSRGAWKLDVFLAGDVTGDLRVDDADVSLLNAAVNGTIDSSSLIPIGDSDRDGHITGFDLAIANVNRSVSTSVRVLDVSVKLDPSSDTGVFGDGIVNRSPVTIVGHTQHGASVTFDRDGDGYDDGSTTAGNTVPDSFTFSTSLAEGPNTLRVRAADSFGQVAFASTVVVLDTDPPAPPIFDLASGSDSDPKGDGQTIEDVVTLSGQTEPLTAVVLDPLGLSITADAAGQFEFSGILLSLGPTSFVARTQDAAGNVSQFEKTIVRLIPETDPPVIIVGLANDTAPGTTTNADGITSDPALAGTITDESRIVSVRIGLDEMPMSAFGEAISDLQTNGSLYLSGSRLQQLFDSTLLAEGSHQLHVWAADEAGNVSEVSTVELVLDAARPPPPALDLSIGSDTGTVGDQTTSAGKVTLVGHSDPNIRVSLNNAAASALASNAGAFLFPDVSLVTGDNLFSSVAVDVAGNESAASTLIHRIGVLAQVDPVLRWNQAALEAVRIDASSPPIATRNLAMVSLAMFDVVSAVEGTPGFYVNEAPPLGISLAAAVTGAAHQVLEYAYPGQSAAIDAVLAAILSDIPDAPSETDSLAYGRQVADAVIAIRSTDGWDRFVDYVPGIAPGDWQPTAPMYDVALLPQWASLIPFAMSRPDEFRPDGPPSLDSAEYAAAFEDVKQLGRATGSSRTADQMQIAQLSGGRPRNLHAPRPLEPDRSAICCRAAVEPLSLRTAAGPTQRGPSRCGHSGLGRQICL